MIRRRCLVAGVLAAPWPARAAVTLRDDLGRILRLPRTPSRIVAINAYAYAQLAALGVRPVGAQIHPRTIRMTEYLHGEGPPIATVMDADWSTNIETVLSLDPDLVIAWNEEIAQAIGHVVPVFVMGRLATIAAMADNLRLLGRVLDREARAEAAIAGFARQRADYDRAVPRKPTMLIASTVGMRRFWIASDSNMATEVLYSIAETRRLAPHAVAGFIDGGIETLLARNPDSILLLQWQTGNEFEVPAGLARDPLWCALRAVREGRVVAIPGTAAMHFHSLPTATRLLDIVAPRLHPGLSPKPMSMTGHD